MGNFGQGLRGEGLGLHQVVQGVLAAEEGLLPLVVDPNPGVLHGFFGDGMGWDGMGCGRAGWLMLKDWANGRIGEWAAAPSVYGGMCPDLFGLLQGSGSPRSESQSESVW